MDFEPGSARGPDQSERGPGLNHSPHPHAPADLGGEGGCSSDILPHGARRKGRREVDLFAQHLQHNHDCQGEGELREAEWAGGGKELNWPERQAETPGSRRKGRVQGLSKGRRLRDWSSSSLGVPCDTRVAKPKPTRRRQSGILVERRKRSRRRRRMPPPGRLASDMLRQGTGCTGQGSKVRT